MTQPATTRRSVFRRLSLVLWLGVIVAVCGLWISRRTPELGAQVAETAAEDDKSEQKTVRLKMGADGTLRLEDEGAPAGPIWDPQGIEDFSLTNCDGRTITKQDLLGRPWVAGFVFTRCTTTCPMITQKMRELQDRLKKEDVQFVTFGVDPDRDSPEVWQKYAEQYGADLSRWYFLWGRATEIYGLIHRSFQMPVQMPNDVTGNYQVIHSNNLMLVDAQGVVQGKYLGTKDEDMAALVRDVRQLLHPERTKPKTTASAAAGEISADAWYMRLPAMNAALNGLAGALLALGYALIKQKRIMAHRNVMLTAFGVSIAFLACYLIYHAALHAETGLPGKKFDGVGPIRPVYFAILISHVVLAAAVPVLAIVTIYRGLKGDWVRHRRIAKITYPIWMYVSVTGVVIYGMLYHWPTAG